MPGIGLIGFGGIARIAARLVDEQDAGPIVVALVRPGREDTVPAGVQPVTSAEALIAVGPDIVAECAGNGV